MTESKMLFWVAKLGSETMTTTKLSVFQNTITKTEQWLQEIADELDWADLKHAWTALRAVLHTLRDQLSIEEATDLSAQLPMLIRGLFFEGWNPAKKHERIRHVEDFTDRVNKHFSDLDIDNLWEPEDITRAVFSVVANHVTTGEIQDVIATLPKPLHTLWSKD